MISQKTGSLTQKTPPHGGVLTDPIAPLPVTFQPDTPYDPADDLAAPDIREDFSDLTYGAGYPAIPTRSARRMAARRSQFMV
jgi:hypothetical protein